MDIDFDHKKRPPGDPAHAYKSLVIEVIHIHSVR